MTLVSALILASLTFGVVAFNRTWAAACMVAGTLYLAMGGGLEIAGMNLFPTRVLGYVCFCRVILNREFTFRHLTKPDNALIALYAFTTIILLIRPGESIPLRVAKMLDVLLTYFAFRGLIKTPEEFKLLLRMIVLMLVPYVAVVAAESILGRNYFEIVGSHGKVWLRDGTPRCFGSFGHPSLFGSLGACFLPLYIGLAWDSEMRSQAILGVVLCLAIVGFSNSGGPMSVLFIAIVGWLAWPLRKRMKLFRLGLLALIALLALIMKAPVWYVLSKVSAVTGGTGWHRSYLMDVAFRNIENWWLVGLPVEETAGWLPYNLLTTGGADITNQFVSFGLSAGIWAIALFIFLLYRSFSHLGRALYLTRELFGDKKEQALLWGLGVALVAHISNWLGITYYDQFYVIWLLQLGALASLASFYVNLHGNSEISDPILDNNITPVTQNSTTFASKSSG